MPIGSLFILTPTIGWAAPLVWPVVLAAAAALGYKHVTSTADNAPLRGQLNQAINSQKVVEIPLEAQVSDAVEGDVGRDKFLRFEKGDIVILFQRDLRGRFSVKVSGPDTMTRRELEFAGREFLGAVVQQFAYNKMAQEMERRGANIVGEEVTEEGDIVLKLRRWE